MAEKCCADITIPTVPDTTSAPARERFRTGRSGTALIQDLPLYDLGESFSDFSFRDFNIDILQKKHGRFLLRDAVLEALAEKEQSKP